MQNEKSAAPVFTREPHGTDTVEIHVTGDMMPGSVFLRILDVMKEAYGKKTIIFVVYSADMARLVRESIPLAFFERVELRSPDALTGEEGLRRAG